MGIIGQTGNEAFFFVRGQKYTIEAALTINGFLAYRIQTGAMNSDHYYNWVEQDLVGE